VPTCAKWIPRFGNSLPEESDSEISTSYNVPFGQQFILHPSAFALGVALEWVRLVSDLAAEVIGKSSLGRHGIIIATATAVHPGSSGCLTLEIANPGEIPVILKALSTLQEK
jgi:dCTP deaminase